MSRLRFPSAISIVLAACGGGGSSPDASVCGPGDAPASLATGSAASLTFSHLSGGLNNDCPAAGAPAGVVSMTITGTQTDNTGQIGLITLCVARPDQLASSSQSLGPDVAGSQVRIVDLSGKASGCSFALDRGQPISGTATSSGLCQSGRDPAGFALSLDGTLSLTRTCGATVDSVQVTLSGRVAVGSG
jgi:hypothetical protein